MKKKKILLLSDDLRLPSGVGSVSKNIVLGTVDKFDWVQLAAAVKHPDAGKILDLSEDARNRTGVQDANVKLYPYSGYGDTDILRALLESEKPDAIIHFTDPRFWGWLYQMEREIRQNIPIFYYTIWDDGPTPTYNAEFYASCDSLYCISKQTYGIVSHVLSEKFGGELRIIGDDDNVIDISSRDMSNHAWVKPWETFENTDSNLKKDVRVKYVPHGIDTDVFKPLADNDPTMIDLKTKIFGQTEPKFVLFYNSRNIRRKMTSDVVVSFNNFLNQLQETDRKDVYLLLHTSLVDENGTDLPAVIKKIVNPEYHNNIKFSSNKIDDTQLNVLYNIADATILISSNEGFGLGTAESVSAGTPIIVNVTGGLQDQCGFKLNGKLLTADDYIELGSLHNYRQWKESNISWGSWAFPIWPRTISLIGSPITPYIYDDRVDTFDVEQRLVELYSYDRKTRKSFGLEGREWLMSDGGLYKDNMCNLFKKYMEYDIENFKSRESFEVVAI